MAFQFPRRKSWSWIRRQITRTHEVPSWPRYVARQWYYHVTSFVTYRKCEIENLLQNELIDLFERWENVKSRNKIKLFLYRFQSLFVAPTQRLCAKQCFRSCKICYLLCYMNKNNTWFYLFSNLFISVHHCIQFLLKAYIS